MPTLVREKVSSAYSKLASLLRGDLDFDSQDSLYASHAIHPFAAKFPPQIPKLFIQELTRAGDSVVDPMAGSGTTLVEALLLRREVFGFDIDPLAIRLCKVKTTWLDHDELQKTGIGILQRAKALRSEASKMRRELLSRFDERTRQFLDYWFLEQTQLELMALALAIEHGTISPVRDFFELVFSSAIIAKSGGVSLARDLAHSRPHRDLSKKPRNAVQEFELRLGKVLRKFRTLPQSIKKVHVVHRDAKDLPLPTDSIDLIVTSPPYANAIDYMRAHKFSLVWLGYGIDLLSQLRGTYVGSERAGRPGSDSLPKICETLIHKVARQDEGKAKVLRKYLCEMRVVLSEMFRILKRNRAAVLVVGPSTMRGVVVPTQELLGEIGESIGFLVAGIGRRKIDRDRRMLPVSFGRNGDSVIEQRMHEEFVVGFIKD